MRWGKDMMKWVGALVSLGCLGDSYHVCAFGGFLPDTRRIDTANCAAAAIAEPFAANAPIQRRQPSVPPWINVNSADHSLTPASHFGGKYANSAQSANRMI
jgi:hypothetical protein